MSVRYFILFLAVMCNKVWAYPDFIAYGYTACITCHFNGQGGGALSDYGRALWSAEIASRSLYPTKMTDEEIGQTSGFLGSKELPWWIRPAIKTRNLYVQRPMGSSSASNKLYYMQVDMNLVLQLDPDGNTIFYFTEGYRPSSTTDTTKDVSRYLGKEYFIRQKIGETYWLYAGLMDKVFGIRQVDHTSYTRVYQNLTQKDQSTGVVLHKIESDWELAGNAFAGNPDEDTSVRQKGMSVMYEKDIGEKKRVSASVLGSSSDLDAYKLYAISYRMGLSKGSSLMAEYGVRDYKLKTADSSKVGSWTAVDSLIYLARGYHFNSRLERYNEEFKASSTDQWKWTMGFLMFPAPRVEVRTDVVTKRDLKETGAADDSWALQGQVHVSL